MIILNKDETSLMVEKARPLFRYHTLAHCGCNFWSRVARDVWSNRFHPGTERIIYVRHICSFVIKRIVYREAYT